MNSTAVQYAGALRHAGCTLSELRRTAGCLTGCAVGRPVLARRVGTGEKGRAGPSARF